MPFVGDEVVKVRVRDGTGPADLYITADMIKLFVRETNRYGDQYIHVAEMGDNIKDHSYAKQWSPTDANEMKTFTGLLFLMGIVFKPRLAMYWSTDELHSTPVFAQVVNRDHFLALLKFNNRDPNYDCA